MNNTRYISDNNKVTFTLFCLWAIVLLARPQDILLFLQPIRPAFTMTIFFALFALAKVKTLPGPSLFQERQMKYFTFMILVMIIGIPFSLFKRAAFEAIFFQYSIVILFVFFMYKLVFSIERLHVVLLLSCLGSGFYSIYALTTGVLYSGRLVYGEMFDPNDLAFFTLGFIPLNFLFINRESPFWIRFFCTISLISGTFVIFLTGSRGGLLAFIIFFFLLLLLKYQTFGKSFKIIITGLCISFFIYSPVNIDRYSTLFQIKEDYNVYDETGRIAIWKIGLRKMLENPLTGVGVGSFNEAVGRDREERGLASTRWQAAHNMIIQFGTENGIIGFFLFSYLSYNAFRIFLNVKKHSLQISLVKISEMSFLGFTGLFISGMFLSQAYSLYWAFFIALSAVIHQLFKKESNNFHAEY
jgi:O-antigen ligase